MGLSFFGFLIPLLTWRLIHFGKSILFGKSQGFPELYVKRNRILWILAERYNILSVNLVEIGYNLAKPHTIWQKPIVLLNCI